MDEFDFIEPKPKKRFRLFSAFANMLTFGVVLSTLAVVAYFVFIFLYPFSPYNPLPPVAQAEEPTATVELVATEEPTATLEPTATEEPTATLEPTATEIPNTPTVTPTRAPGSYYEIQEGSPAYLDSSVFHPDLECNFLGVAGQAFGLDDSPIPGVYVQVSGDLEGENIEMVALTGAATHYGSGSYYEIQLSDTPSDTEGLDVILLDADGEAISDAFSFNTSSACDENLVLINFKALP